MAYKKQINVNVRRYGTAVTDAGWNDIAVTNNEVVQTLSSDLKDSNDQLTGIGLSISKPFSGTHISTTPVAFPGWPLNTSDRGYEAIDNGISAVKFSGLFPNEKVRVDVQYAARYVGASEYVYLRCNGVLLATSNDEDTIIKFFENDPIELTADANGDVELEIEAVGVATHGFWAFKLFYDWQDASSPITGTASGVSILSASIGADGLLVGPILSNAVVSASLVGLIFTSGESTGTAIIAGNLTAKAGNNINADIAGTATITADIGLWADIQAQADGTATVTGDLTAKAGNNINADIAGIATVSGALSLKAEISGTATGQATVTATLRAIGSGDIASAITGQASTTGSISYLAGVTGNIAGQATVTALITGQVEGSMNSIIGGSSALMASIQYNLSGTGTSSGTAQISAIIGSKLNVISQADGSTLVTGTLQNAEQRNLAADITAQDVVSGDLAMTAWLNGTTSGGSQAAGDIAATISLIGGPAGGGIVSADIAALAGIAAAAAGGTTITAFADNGLDRITELLALKSKMIDKFTVKSKLL